MRISSLLLIATVLGVLASALPSKENFTEPLNKTDSTGPFRGDEDLNTTRPDNHTSKPHDHHKPKKNQNFRGLQEVPENTTEVAPDVKKEIPPKDEKNQNHRDNKINMTDDFNGTKNAKKEDSKEKGKGKAEGKGDFPKQRGEETPNNETKPGNDHTSKSHDDNKPKNNQSLRGLQEVPENTTEVAPDAKKEIPRKDEKNQNHHDNKTNMTDGFNGTKNARREDSKGKGKGKSVGKGGVPKQKRDEKPKVPQKPANSQAAPNATADVPKEKVHHEKDHHNIAPYSNLTSNATGEDLGKGLDRKNGGTENPEETITP